MWWNILKELGLYYAIENGSVYVHGKGNQYHLINQEY